MKYLSRPRINLCHGPKPYPWRGNRWCNSWYLKIYSQGEFKKAKASVVQGMRIVQWKWCLQSFTETWAASSYKSANLLISTLSRCWNRLSPKLTRLNECWDDKSPLWIEILHDKFLWELARPDKEFAVFTSCLRTPLYSIGYQMHHSKCAF